MLPIGGFLTSKGKLEVEWKFHPIFFLDPSVMLSVRSVILRFDYLQLWDTLSDAVVSRKFGNYSRGSVSKPEA